MAGIKIISTSTIQASPSDDVISNSPQKIHLTPWDLETLPLEMMQEGLLFHNPINNNTKDQTIQHLKHSLSSTLTFFPPLGGRLVILEHGDNTASCYILCNNAGVLFLHAVSDNKTHVNDILKSNYVPSCVSSFFPFSKVNNYEGTSQPLLAVQVTELVDGIFVGCTYNHVAVDGNSFWHFINSWAEISRSPPGDRKKIITKLPTLKRYFVDGVIPPIPFAFSKQEKEKQRFQHFKPKTERVFHFTKEKIALLKSKANAEASTDKISSLQALLTHVWRTVIRNQNLDPHKDTCYMVYVGTRARMVEALAENYFGNAGLLDYVVMKVWELLEEGGLGKGAWEMNKMISLYSGEKIKSLYESWLRNPSMLRIPDVGYTDILSTRSSPRFDVYGNDFGWGKPVAVRTGGAKIHGNITMYEGAEEGNIEIQVCLPYEILEAMGNDPEFVDAISI